MKYPTASSKYLGSLVAMFCWVVPCLGMDPNEHSQGGSVNTDSTRTVSVFERSTKTLEGTGATVDGGEVYLTMKFLTERLGLKRKALGGGKVGICQKDMCVPFSVGEAPTSIRRVDDREFVPVTHLAKSLRGASVWHAAEDDLLLDLTSRPAATLAAHPDHLNLTLPDLAGKPTALSSFRGKKVLVFAWASW